MLTLVSIICLGFFLGMWHVTDADHVIAVGTIASHERRMRNAVGIGALWGLGHTLTLMVVGAGIILFGLIISPRVGMSVEFSMGLVLILLGAWSLLAFGQWFREQESNRDDREPSLTWLDKKLGRMPLYQAARPFVVGMAHGTAGSAALALMVVPMIHNPYWAVAYLGVFGIGTIAGMAAITLAIAVPVSDTASSISWNRALGLAAGFASVCLGAFMVYHISFIQRLLAP